VRSLIEELLQREPYRSSNRPISSLAEAIKISQPALSTIRSGGGVSAKTAASVARLAGINPGDVLGEPGGDVMTRSRFPKLEICIAYHGERRWRESTVAAARAGLWPDDVEPEAWARRLDQIESSLSRLSMDTES
jgi:hypothetical protein